MVQLHGKRFFYVPWTGAMLDGTVVYNITWELIYNDGRFDAPNHSVWYESNIDEVYSETGVVIDPLTVHAIFRSLVWEADPTDGGEVWLDEYEEDFRDDTDFWTWQTLAVDDTDLPVIDPYPGVPDFDMESEDDDNND